HPASRLVPARGEELSSSVAQRPRQPVGVSAFGCPVVGLKYPSGGRRLFPAVSGILDGSLLPAHQPLGTSGRICRPSLGDRSRPTSPGPIHRPRLASLPESEIH